MPIQCSPSGWVLQTRQTAYAIGLNQAGLLTQRYWGPRLPYLADYPAPINPLPLKFGGAAQLTAQENLAYGGMDAAAHLSAEEYPAYAGIKYTDPAFKLTFADGVRDCVLVYQDYSVSKGPIAELSLHLMDEHYPLRLTLHYRVHAQYDLIERWVSFENLGTEPILLERAFSAKLTLPPGEDYFLTHAYGRWADEFHLKREALSQGLKSIESRRLNTSLHASPWFAIDRRASEQEGDVWFGSLAWSGNWKISAEVTEFGSTRVSLGLNDWDFAWKLMPGEPLVTPPALAGFTRGGFGAASRLLHAYVREQLLPHGTQLHKVLYNSWEATTFNVDEPSQLALAELAVKMGVELFVMDDGWFHKRNLDNAGLGDWWPDETKFPNGLGSLVEKVNALGMDFGLWLEPEMVNPDSELYRAHPDWVIHFPTRARSQSRQQLILNLARADVQEYLIEAIDKILSSTNIAFIKWDMNRSASEPGWPEAPGDPREIWVRYVHGLYRVWAELRARHPQVIWQSCSSGGGRADFGILQLADQVWTSDNTEPSARLSIQEGFSQFLPANSMEAWVTDWGKQLIPLEFRFHVSMCGSLGVGGNLLEWSEDERALAAECIALYKEIRPIVQQGQLYRLISAQNAQYSALQYVSADAAQAVLFVFRLHMPERVNLPMIYLQGLDAQTLYSLDGFEAPRSGAAWMHAGLKVEIGDLQSKLLRLRRVLL